VGSCDAQLTMAPMGDGVCTPVPGLGGSYRWDAGTNHASALCEARIPPQAPLATVSVCEARGTGECTGDDTCVPSPPAGFEPALCILQSAQTTDCPVGYPVARSVLTAWRDERACSPCACPIAQVTCNYNNSVTLHATSACASAGTIVAEGSCQPGGVSRHVRWTDQPTTQCGPPTSASIPIGAVVPTASSLLCCMNEP
jgi:hypothetical protein